MARRRGTMRSSSLDLRRSLRQTRQYHHLGAARHHHSHEDHHHSHEAPHRHLTSCEVVAAVGCGPRHQRCKFQLAGAHNEEAQSWTTQQFRNWLRTDAGQKANGQELMIPSVPRRLHRPGSVTRLSSPHLLIGSAFSCTPLKIRACKRRTCQGQRCRQATLAGSAALWTEERQAATVVEAAAAVATAAVATAAELEAIQAAEIGEEAGEEADWASQSVRHGRQQEVASHQNQGTRAAAAACTDEEDAQQCRSSVTEDGPLRRVGHPQVLLSPAVSEINIVSEMGTADEFQRGEDELDEVY